MNDPIEKAKEIIEEFKHFGPGPHKGTGTPQSVHAGFKKLGGAGVLAAVGGMERTQAREYVARLREQNPKFAAPQQIGAGSGKQIEWASKIRSAAISDLMTRRKADLQSGDKRDIRDYDKVINILNSVGNSAFFIEQIRGIEPRKLPTLFRNYSDMFNKRYGLDIKW